MINPESILEYTIHKILWDSEIQTGQQIPARRPDLVIVNKKKKREPAMVWKKIKQKMRQVLGLCLITKNAIAHEVDGDINNNWNARNNPLRISKGTGRHINQRTSVDYPDYNIIKINQNNEKSPGSLSSLALTQPPWRKTQQLMLVGKNSQGIIIIVYRYTYLPPPPLEFSSGIYWSTAEGGGSIYEKVETNGKD